MKISCIAIIVALFLFLLACEGYPDFDGKKAYEYLVKQCEMGPRFPGSPGHEKLKNFLINFLKPRADSIIVQNFTGLVKADSVTLQLTNIVATFRGGSGKSLLIGAHWDTRPRAEYHPEPEKRGFPILGANDGASGVAILLHLAELLEEKAPPRTVHLVFFDGEDWGYQGSTRDFCLGSRHLAANLPFPKPDEAIIVDMVGDKVLSIPIERFSYEFAPELVKKIWDTAKKRGYRQFEYRLGSYIYDDHVPLYKTAGVSSIDIIDFEYPDRFHNYWHTLYDTPDKCSPRSLKVVGQVLVDYIFSRER